MTRLRADQLLLARGLVESRARAQAEIEAGHVRSGAHVVEKPSERLAEDAPLALEGTANPYVSRGGLKLAHALDHFGSAWGAASRSMSAPRRAASPKFCSSRGAARVYAVDVGHGQLHPRLKADERVISIEGVDARKLSRAQVSGNAWPRHASM